MMDEQTLYVVLACVLVLAGSAFTIPLARQSLRAAFRPPPIDIEPWGPMLNLEYEADRDARYPRPRLQGKVDGYDVQVCHGVVSDGDGDVYEHTIVLMVESRSASKWPTAISGRGRAKLAKAHPHLATLLAEVNGSRGVDIALRCVECSIPLPKEPDPGLPARVQETLHRGVELARALDMTFPRKP